MLDIKSLCDDHDIRYWTSGKNVSEGWINIRCPFCDDSSNHLGFSPQGKFYCWKCGGKHLMKVIQRICDVDAFTARALSIRYDKSARFHLLKDKKIEHPDILEMPKADPYWQHGAATKYLTHRGFNPEEIIDKYNIYVASYLDQEYKARIIIPIYYRGKPVSFVARAYRSDLEPRYKTCPKEKEVIPNKHILYNLDNCKKDYCIVVEGIFDCWRMGDDCCATLGASWTEWQVSVLLRRFKKICILFDNDDTGIKQGTHLKTFIEIMGGEAMHFAPDGVNDPGELSPEKAIELKTELTNILG